MAGKLSSSFVLPSGSFLTVLIIASYLSIMSSSGQSTDPNLRPLYLDDFGAYCRLIVEEIEFLQSNLSLEVSACMNNYI